MIFKYIESTLNKAYTRLTLWHFIFIILGIFSYVTYHYNNIINLKTTNKYIEFIIIFSVTISTHIISKIYLSNYIYKIQNNDEYNLSKIFIIKSIKSFLIGASIASFNIIMIKNAPLTNEIINSKNGIYCNISGKVKSIRQSHNKQSKIILENITFTNNSYNKKIISNSKNIKINKLLLQIPQNLSDKLFIGSYINSEVKLYPIQSSIVPNGYDFGFYSYMDGIQATGYITKNFKIIRTKNYNIGNYFEFIKKEIQKARSKIHKRIIDSMGSLNGEFTAAILIGESRAINEEIMNKMRNSGLSHILCVSGLHLSLVTIIFFLSSRILLNLINPIFYNFNTKNIAASIALLGSFFYLIISGSHVATTRAFIMNSIYIISIIMGRNIEPMRSVLFAAIMILSIYPAYIFHPSFQLSFIAVLCLISGYEIYNKNILLPALNFDNKNLTKYSGKFIKILQNTGLYIFTNLYSTILTSILGGPIIIYHFYNFPLYSVLSNLIAIPIMSFIIMPIALLSLILMPIGLDIHLLKFLSHFIEIIIDLTTIISSMPNHILRIGNASNLNLGIFIFGFLWFCIWSGKIRLLGLIFIFLSCYLMSFHSKMPYITYDKRTEMLIMQDIETKNLTIYYQEKKLPKKFAQNYWRDWYGLSNKQTVTLKKLISTDRIINLPYDMKLSFNKSKCHNADIQINLNDDLICKHMYNDKNIVINNEQLENKNFVLIYCDKKPCYINIR